MGLKVDFKVKHDDNRGIYYSETERCVIYLPNHETLEDIYKTITHELIHFCLDKNHENENMDEDMEERLIFCTQWAEESL
jgi:Zn-dependent peptidase ImmA (M78 family)|tara:strand:- start:765 stop:1004 length:240 start_codon:yes stop_codon:yes gene_type:complete